MPRLEIHTTHASVPLISTWDARSTPQSLSSVVATALVLGAIAPWSLTAGPVHVASDAAVGGFYWNTTLRGEVSGILSPDLGRGRLAEDTAAGPGLELSLPVRGFYLDASLLSLEHETTTGQAFSFGSVFYPAGASVRDRKLLPEVILRAALLERASLAIYVLGGVRAMITAIRVNDGFASSRLFQTFLLPEAGASLWIWLHPNLSVFGGIKYFDRTRRRQATYTIDVDSGITYQLRAPGDSGLGLLVTAGFRFLELEAKGGIATPEQANFDTIYRGPYVSVMRQF